MNRADQFARLVSLAFTPLLLPAAVAALVLLDIGSGGVEIAATVSLALACFLIVPLADILWMVSRGKTPSPDVPNREARTEPFAVAIVFGSIAILAIRVMGMHGEPIIHAILVTYVINLILMMGINAAWKISVHMAGLGGSIAILLLVAGLSGESSALLSRATVVPLLLLVPLVGWARYRVKAHTMAQIVVGAVLGFCGAWLVLLAQVGQ